MPLSTLRALVEDLTATIESLRDRLERLHGSWSSLHEAWTPLLKLLVRVQNRYLPEVTGRSTLLYDVEKKIQVEPWRQEVEFFDASAVAQELGVEHDLLKRPPDQHAIMIPNATPTIAPHLNQLMQDRALLRYQMSGPEVDLDDVVEISRTVVRLLRIATANRLSVSDGLDNDS